jgi:2,4-dienoyl-CoA reductase-like NADH-dependent reductase (Old Yellow Enzyme family)
MLARKTADAGADIIDLSAGMYTIDRRLIYPNRGDAPLSGLTLGRELLRDSNCLVAVAGNVLSTSDLPSDYPDRLLVNVGRSLIADPGFASKLREGRELAVTSCRRTGRCHYFSRRQTSLSCGSNPAI